MHKPNGVMPITERAERFDKERQKEAEKEKLAQQQAERELAQQRAHDEKMQALLDRNAQDLGNSGNASSSIDPPSHSARPPIRRPGGRS